jgi:hypothetical protein
MLQKLQNGLAGLAMLATAVAAQTPAAESAVVYHGRTGHTDVVVPKMRLAPVVDGHLSDAAWRAAGVLTGFSQYNPVDRRPATDSTEVLVVYDDNAIYFGVRAFESHGDVAATLADRDKLVGNDHVELLLDTFDDRRRALLFGVNAFGIQSDGTYVEGSGVDRSPDFIFESKGRLTDYGYEVEIRIPFKSIRYQQMPTQQWGIQVLRRVMHSGAEETWTPAERGAPSFLEQSGRLVALTGLRRGLVMDVNPVMTATTPGGPRSETDRTWKYRHEDPEFGGTVRWAATPNVSLTGTLNPDFSQVESDVGQTIFDPRQAIAFPERRPFFLEANENFQVPNALIFTRRIVSPVAAIKVSGKVGDNNVGVLSARDDGAAEDPLFNILRLRRDVGPGSTVGMVYTDRVQGTDYNRVAAVDTRLLVGSRYVFSGQVGTSFTESAGIRADGRPLFDFSVVQTGRSSGFSAVFKGIHPEFETASGFIPRAGIVRVVLQPRRTWFPQNSVFQSISFTPISDNTWEWDRFVGGTEPNDIKLNTSTTAVLRGGWNATLYTWTETFKYPAYLYTDYFVERQDAGGAAIDTVPFVGTDRLTNIGVNTRLGTPQWRRFSASVDVAVGQDDNFDEWSSAWILYTTIEVDWRPTEQLRVNLRHLEQRVDRKSDGSLVRLRAIPRLKVEYQLARPIFIRVVGQYDGLKVDELRDDSRTGHPILIQTETGFRRASAINRGGLRVDGLFSYQPNPGTVFFAGYGASMGSTGFEPSELQRTSDGFFVKLSYLFRTR